MSQTSISPTPAAILEHRAKAAELSGGTTGNAIYSMIERVIAERGLQGRILDYGAGMGLRPGGTAIVTTPNNESWPSQKPAES